MATTLSPPTKVGYGAWRYTWTGTAPFRVWSYDTYSYLLDSTDDTEITVAAIDHNNIEPPAIAVYDSTETTIPEGVTYPARLVLQWRGYRYAEYYRIEKETSPGVFTTVQGVAEDGQGYYQCSIAKVTDDVSEDTYRVVTVDKSGAETDTEITAVIIRNPDPPKLTYTYSAGTGLLTIAAA